ncbi:DUF2079 domain-containing protein [Actinoplanes auranticolor]|uniref:Glycosyl transferase n=1 Tax=Actinoplanes auranticolor TaxID=47988 RepID=A0A919SG18_9ACTN|nr:glycosyl transferase [Actinoplanes auranticolor]
MSVVAAAPSEPADPPVESPTRRGGRSWRPHLIVAVVALALAVWVTNGLWRDPAGHVIAKNAGDQAFFEWLLGYGVYLLGHGADPFFTDLMNTPVGVNLAANTSITVYIVLFSPLTVLAGPEISFATILTLNLAAAAFTWYLFLRRYLVRQPAAAALGGLFCGFAPGFISHANGHLNWTAGWIPPLVLWWVLKLPEPRRWLRHGLILGVLVAVGFSIAAEGLFFTALATGVFLVTRSLMPHSRAAARAALPTVLAGLGVTAAVAGILLAYPLYMHFAGPQTFKGTGFNQAHYAEDIGAYLGYPTRSLAGWLGLGSDLAPNPTEETSFFGLPLIVLAVACLVTLRRHARPGRFDTLIGLYTVGAVFLLLSLGPQLKFFKDTTEIKLPYAALIDLPLFDSALPGRFALVVACVIGVLLALAADRLLTDPVPPVRERAQWAAAFAVALVPLFPMPVLTGERAPEPAFIADGIWKEYVSDGGVLTALPFATTDTADGQRWQAYTMARGGKQFRIPDGYFLGPGGPEGVGQIGASPRQTDWKFLRAALYGEIVPIGDYDREQTRNDLAYWKVEAVFLAPQVTGSQGPVFRAALEMTATDLFGEPERVGGVLLWRIRPGIDPVARGN